VVALDAIEVPVLTTAHQGQSRDRAGPSWGERIPGVGSERITDVPELFPGPVLASLRDASTAPAFEVGSRTVSRGELLAMVRRVAGGLRDAGLGPRSGVGIVLSPSPEAYAVHLAAHALGCRVGAARPGWSPQQLAHALGGQVDAVVADSPFNGPVLPLGDVLTGSDPGGSVPLLARPDDIARLTYTSGSTGQPKACAHTYRSAW
jgi:fatty-acyl-CoA synthase